MNKEIEIALKDKLNRRIQRETFRSLPQENHLLDFSSNDYLGFATDHILHPNLENIASGSKASRLISGNTHLHESLESYISSYHHAEAGLLFNSGYDANVGLLGCIAQKNDTILYDELSHASIRDGMKMSLGNSIPFRHNDIQHLNALLSAASGHKFVVTEGVFSMDGDVAPLKEMIACCKKHQAAIIIDEAHSNGIIGDKGRGLVSYLGLESDIFARVHTFGKALGCHGAIILGSKTLKNYLINYARSFIFTTAISPHHLKYIECAYEILSSTDRIEKLQLRIKVFRDTLKINVREHFLPSISPIQSLIIKGADRTREIASKIQKEGYDVKPIVSPTVALGEERIRICIHAFNSEKDVVCLAKTINQLIS